MVYCVEGSSPSTINLVLAPSRVSLELSVPSAELKLRMKRSAGGAGALHATDTESEVTSDK